MPWTPRQTRYLLSKGSPLTGGQREKMLGELHDNPSLATAKRGSIDLKKLAGRRKRAD